MIPAANKNEALLSEIREHPSPAGQFRLWWLGQSGFPIQYDGQHLLFDPYLSDSLTKKYAETDKQHVRMSELVIEPGKLDFIDLITSSHNHTDHLDAETLRPLLGACPDANLLVPRANRAFAADRLKVDEGLLSVINAGEKLTFGHFEIHAVPAAHETLDQDAQGNHRYIGLVAKFGDWTVYHSGDTMLFDGMVDILKPFDIDLTLLPINGRKPERRVSGNLWGKEAAQLTKDIGARHVIPCHYDMFTFNTETTEEFETTCKDLSLNYTVLKGGQTFSSTQI